MNEEKAYCYLYLHFFYAQWNSPDAVPHLSMRIRIRLAFPNADPCGSESGELLTPPRPRPPCCWPA